MERGENQESETKKENKKFREKLLGRFLWKIKWKKMSEKYEMLTVPMYMSFTAFTD